MSGQAKPSLGRYGPIEVFRTGSFLNMTGKEHSITETTLRDLAARYDREQAPAPVVIGHPVMDAPAYGWVESLYVQGGVLKATLEDTSAEFADMVKAGHYKRVSISMFPPNSATNPKPGSFYLKHVGFLGAAAPAVPGLKPVQFAGGAADTFHIYQDNLTSAEFAAGDELMRLRRQMREFEVEKLIDQGRVLPVFKDEVIAFAASLDDDQTVSFSEAGGAVTRKDWFMSYLARQPQAVSFGEMNLPSDPLTTPARAKRNIPDGYQVDGKNASVAFAAEQIAKERGISFVDAVDLVMEGRA